MDAYTLTLYDDAGNPIPIPAIQGVGIKEIRLKEAGEVEDTYEIVLDDERVYTFVVKHGKDGKPGVTPHIGANGNWFVGDADTGVKAQGKNGDDYVLTDADKSEIAQIAVDLLPKYNGEVEDV